MKRLSVLFILLAIGVATGTFAQEKALTIDECVAFALENNPDIVRGEFTVKIAGKNVTVALANFLPRISSNLGYYYSVVGPSSQMRIDPQTGIPVPLQPNEIKSWSYTSGFSINETILDGGYSIFNYVQRRHEKNSAEFTFDDTRQTTILLVKQRYYDLLKAEKLLEVAEETLRSSEESYKRSEVLYEVGRAPKSDVLQAKVQLETDRLGLIQAQNSLAVARAFLNHVLGFDVEQKITIVDDLDVSELGVTYEDAMENALTRHPSLHSRQFDVKAARAGVGSAVASFLPSLYGYYSYSWRHAEFNQLKSMFDTDYSWYYGFQLSIPIFQGTSRFANTGIARLNYKSSLEALEQGKRDVAMEAKQAYFDVQQFKKSIAVSNNAVEAAEEGLRLNQEKYSLGAGTMLDLITAQVSYTQAQSDYINALYDYKYAVARLEKAMGILSD